MKKSFPPALLLICSLVLVFGILSPKPNLIENNKVPSSQPAQELLYTSLSNTPIYIPPIDELEKIENAHVWLSVQPRHDDNKNIRIVVDKEYDNCR